MPIEIRQVGPLYAAVASPPRCERAWSSPMPLPVAELDRRLFDLGCLPAEVAEAFYEAMEFGPGRERLMPESAFRCGRL